MLSHCQNFKLCSSIVLATMLQYHGKKNKKSVSGVRIEGLILFPVISSVQPKAENVIVDLFGL